MPRFNSVLFLTVIAPLICTSAFAQNIAGCETEMAASPERLVMRCGSGLSIEFDAGSMARVTPGRDGTPGRVTVDEGAALFSVTPGAAAPQVRTPHAIAAVRGTLYVVDVTPDATSVFVQKGEVRVRQRGVGDRVTLGPGEGVDVTGEDTLVVRTWGAARVSALLARFGL